MENTPKPPFGYENQPDDSGESKDAKKKKKKTTRVPLRFDQSGKKQDKEAIKPPKALFGGMAKELEPADDKKEKAKDDKPAESEPSQEQPSSTEVIADEDLEGQTENTGGDAAETEGHPAAEERQTEIPTEGELSDDTPLVINQVQTDTPSPKEVAAAPIEELADETAADMPQVAAEEFESTPAAAEFQVPPEHDAVAPQEPELALPIPLEMPNSTNPAILHEQMIDPSRAEALPIGTASVESRDTPGRTDTEETNDAYRRGKKRGLGSGVLSGGVVGYALGRRGRRRAERKAEEALEATRTQDKELTYVRDQQSRLSERLNDLRQVQEQAQPQEQLPAEPEIKANAPKRADYSDRGQEMPLSVLEIQAATAPARAEAVPGSNKKEQASKDIKPEIPPEEKPITEETYLKAPGRRVETSSWHRYEIDEKTGKVVENAQAEYGEAFRQERRQELKSPHIAEPKKVSKVGYMAVAGGSAVVNMPGSQSNRQSSTGTPKQASLPLSASNSKKATARVSVRRQLLHRTTDPMTWLISAAIVVLLLMLGVF